MLALVSFDDYKVQLHEKENFYNTTDPFGSEQEFMIAAALTAYDGDPSSIEDPSYGQLRIFMKKWGENDESN